MGIAALNETSIGSRLLLQDVVSEAVSEVLKEADRRCPEPNRKALYLDSIRQAWLRSLRGAFARHYDTQTIPRHTVVYGGKPGDGETRQHGVATGLRQWAPRWEFMYDVAVLRVQWVDAAYAHNRLVPLVQDALWVVESEIAGDGTKVAEDASKLRVSRAENMLLIASQTTQAASGRWLEFLGKTLKDVDGNCFLALLPSYASGARGAKQWLNKTIEINLYQCDAQTGLPEAFANMTSANGQIENNRLFSGGRT